VSLFFADSERNVRCLGCGDVYTKPADGGTMRENPGCPSCGYVGWVAAVIPVTEALEPRRFGADRRPPRLA
jgi:hypothetical protein